MNTALPPRLHRFALRRGGQISAVTALLVFIVFLFEAWGLPFGTLARPGPGLWPMVVIVCGIAAAIVLFFIDGDTPVLAEDRKGARLWFNIAALIAFIPLYTLLGFVPSAAIVLFVLIRFAGKFGWPTTLLCSVLGSAGVYTVFGIMLGLPIDAF